MKGQGMSMNTIIIAIIALIILIILMVIFVKGTNPLADANNCKTRGGICSKEICGENFAYVAVTCPKETPYCCIAQK